jgi:hypothetical protein
MLAPHMCGAKDVVPTQLTRTSKIPGAPSYLTKIKNDLGDPMSRGSNRQNESVSAVLRNAESDLQSAFNKSALTKHSGSKGNARAIELAQFLQSRLPTAYGVECQGEAVDYLDVRSGELDIIIYDKSRNAVLSRNPLWVPAEAVLACIEVKSKLTKAEVSKTLNAMKLLNVLRPFGRRFLLENISANDESLTPSGKQPKKVVRSRCFRTLFAYDSDLSKDGWLMNEWARFQVSASECMAPMTALDRILVMGRGLITPVARAGTEDIAFASVFHQWFIHLANFLERENGRRPPLDWQKYSKKRIPGWGELPTGAGKK